MGYSISVAFKNEKEKNDMKAFFQDNQELMNEIWKIVDYSPQFYVQEKNEMGYAPKAPKNLLGFSNTTLPLAYWNLCAWMATKSTNRSRGNPYLYYDSQKIPVIVNPPSTLQTTHPKVNCQGLPLEKNLSKYEKMFNPDYPQFIKLLEVLEIKWEAQQLNKKLDKSKKTALVKIRKI